MPIYGFAGRGSDQHLGWLPRKNPRAFYIRYSNFDLRGCNACTRRCTRHWL